MESVAKSKMANIATKARQTFFDLTNSGTDIIDVLENVIAGFVLFMASWTIFVYICIATGRSFVFLLHLSPIMI